MKGLAPRKECSWMRIQEETAANSSSLSLPKVKWSEGRMRGTTLPSSARLPFGQKEQRRDGKFKFELPSNSMGIGDWGLGRRAEVRLPVGGCGLFWGRKVVPFVFSQSIEHRAEGRVRGKGFPNPVYTNISLTNKFGMSNNVNLHRLLKNISHFRVPIYR